MIVILGMLLVSAGAILWLAVTDSVGGVDLDIVGLILIAAGLMSMLLAAGIKTRTATARGRDAEAARQPYR